MTPLGYSTNLHRAETCDEVGAALAAFAGPARERLGWERLGVDLRLGLAACADDDAAVDRLRGVLDRHRLSAHTLNGFPLLPFQADRVKEAAYRPDWRTDDRAAATLRLAHMALRLCDDAVITISTCPGGYRPDGCDGRAAAEAVATRLGRTAAALARLERDSGRRVVLALEPEPWCLIETATDAAWFWRGPLAEAGLAAATQALDGDAVAARTALATHLGLCFDTCHASVAFEDPVLAVAALTAAGIPIAKCQVSAALEADADPAGIARLAAMAEPRFLHQSVVSSGASQVRCRDLDGLAQTVERLPQATTIRSHFHVPIDGREPAPGLRTTVAESAAGLRAALDAGCRHVAVETYTWSVLPGGPHDILAGTVSELAALARLSGANAGAIRG